MNIINRYKITYPNYANGNGMQQFKNLIEHDCYINDIKPKYIEISLLEGEQTKYNKKNDKFKEIGDKIKSIKTYIKKTYGDEFFTTLSPLYMSISNNGIMILPEWQGKEIKVTLEKQ